MAGNQGGVGWSAHDWRETRGIYPCTGGKPAENSEKKKEFCSEYSEKVITWNRQFWGCSGKSNYHQKNSFGIFSTKKNIPKRVITNFKKFWENFQK